MFEQATMSEMKPEPKTLEDCVTDAELLAWARSHVLRAVHSANHGRDKGLLAVGVLVALAVKGVER